ncbi:MAG: enoyl-CoA hydratase/isomerase family protein [Cyanobacteria bacterium]|nr:enoyl-CoA hydratase/isomerase family protein [Cyanobacteriota bacterium]
MVRLTTSDGTARLVLADPASANALGETMVHALTAAFDAIDRDPEVRVVVMSGEGETFSSGAPRELLLRLAAGELRPADIVLPRLLLDCSVPVVAAMAGHATGGGFALGLAADIVLIAEDSRYGFTFMNLGFTPGMGTTMLCEHVLSAAVAHELLYTGELRRGRRFAGSGINHVLPRRQVEIAAMDLAARIAEKPRQAVTALKRTLSLPRRRAFETSVTQESLMHQITLTAASRLIEDSYVE